jgi:Flp pilus assembly protein TadG
MNRSETISATVERHAVMRRRLRLRAAGQGRSGLTLVYAIMMMTALCGFASLAVDWGRVQMMKTQLQRAADAAARAAAAQLAAGNGVSATQNAAVTWAGYNTADNTSVVINGTSDVDFGTWDSSAKTFTVLTGAARSSANAVRVWARRTAARGTALNLTFGTLVGQPTCDVNVWAIAINAAPPSPGVVGINTMNINQASGGAIDSYDSSQGVYNSGTNSGQKAIVASNANINLNNSLIDGDVHPGVGKSVSGGGYTVSGTVSALTSALSYSAVVVGSYDNSGLPTPYYSAGGPDFKITTASTVTIPAGTYYIHDFQVKSGGVLQTSGPVLFYVYHNFDIDGGTINAYQHHPGNFVVQFVSGASPQVHNGASVEADLYGPAVTITIKDNNTGFYGRAIAHDLQQSGASHIAQDVFLTGNGVLSSR